MRRFRPLLIRIFYKYFYMSHNSSFETITQHRKDFKIFRNGNLISNQDRPSLPGWALLSCIYVLFMALPSGDQLLLMIKTPRLQGAAPANCPDWPLSS